METQIREQLKQLVDGCLEEEVTFKMTLYQQGEDTDKSKDSEALTLPNEQSREPRVFVWSALAGEGLG